MCGIERKWALATSFLLIITLFTNVPPVQAISWSPSIRLTWNESDDWCPSICQASDGKVWIVWHSQRSGNYEIFYKTYDASLVHPWSPDTRLTIDAGVDRNPSIMQAADGRIWVVWSSNRAGNYEIFYTTYNGFWLPEPKRLTTHPKADEFPSILQDSSGKIWVVWSSDRMGDPGEIFCSTSSDNGANWSPAVRLTTNKADDWYPSIAEDTDGSIWIVWVRDNALYYKILFKNMTEKLTDTLLTKSSGWDWHPRIMKTKNGAIWVTWGSDRYNVGRNSDIFYKIYNGSWSSDLRLTQSAENDLMPSITQTLDGHIWIAWASTAFDNVDIYYRTDRTLPPHDVAIFSVIPSYTVTFQGGKNVSIEVVTQNHGTKDETLTVKCHVNTTLIGSATFHLAAGQLFIQTFKWAPSHNFYGSYIVSANVTPVPGETNLADNTKNADNLVEVRIMGDICSAYHGALMPVSDGRVNLDDLMIAIGQYGTKYPIWNPIWGSLCDLNGDNAVDINDIMMISLHYGKTRRQKNI